MSTKKGFLDIYLHRISSAAYPNKSWVRSRREALGETNPQWFCYGRRAALARKHLEVGETPFFAI
jgi:hypothetical protein